ncbi:hypothetical protein H9P43_009140 [Blastocladiella emersonii ATCC 22665]|nr:hypothetical protein H9P43_009140 [Blastocladiella emersonii ATCC 22665]
MPGSSNHLMQPVHENGTGTGTKPAREPPPPPPHPAVVIPNGNGTATANGLDHARNHSGSSAMSLDPSPTSLASLPPELLLQIARHLASLFTTLRTANSAVLPLAATCRAMYRLLTPVLWERLALLTPHFAAAASGNPRVAVRGNLAVRTDGAVVLGRDGDSPKIAPVSWLKSLTLGDAGPSDGANVGVQPTWGTLSLGDHLADVPLLEGANTHSVPSEDSSCCDHPYALSPDAEDRAHVAFASFVSHALPVLGAWLEDLTVHIPPLLPVDALWRALHASGVAATLASLAVHGCTPRPLDLRGVTLARAARVVLAIEPADADAAAVALASLPQIPRCTHLDLWHSLGLAPRVARQLGGLVGSLRALYLSLTESAVAPFHAALVPALKDAVQLRDLRLQHVLPEFLHRVPAGLVGVRNLVFECENATSADLRRFLSPARFPNLRRVELRFCMARGSIEGIARFTGIEEVTLLGMEAWDEFALRGVVEDDEDELADADDPAVHPLAHECGAEDAQPRTRWPAVFPAVRRVTADIEDLKWIFTNASLPSLARVDVARLMVATEFAFATLQRFPNFAHRVRTLAMHPVLAESTAAFPLAPSPPLAGLEQLFVHPDQLAGVPASCLPRLRALTLLGTKPADASRNLVLAPLPSDAPTLSNLARLELAAWTESGADLAVVEPAGAAGFVADVFGPRPKFPGLQRLEVRAKPVVLLVAGAARFDVAWKNGEAPARRAWAAFADAVRVRLTGAAAAVGGEAARARARARVEVHVRVDAEEADEVEEAGECLAPLVAALTRTVRPAQVTVAGGSGVVTEVVVRRIAREVSDGVTVVQVE